MRRGGSNRCAHSCERRVLATGQGIIECDKNQDSHLIRIISFAAWPVITFTVRLCSFHHSLASLVSSLTLSRPAKRVEIHLSRDCALCSSAYTSAAASYDFLEYLKAIPNPSAVVEFEPNSTAAVQGSSRGCGRRGRGNTNPVTSQKRDGGGRVVSDAWNHFKKVKLGEEVQAICNYCGLVMQGHYSRGTNHLINHAKRCPRRSFKNVQQMHLSFSSKVDGCTSLSNCSSESKWDMATVKLFVARMIVLHELPLAFVEYVGFYDLLKLRQPSIKTISRNTIKA
ncbi:hypothetical protein WN944_011618 [Citrus x changshan-huyou]|uniref:BED-type domain-containing protein n=1 Tax=Citrus x changshan-huyou TaxID=2935761 RepID=A0AAP0MWB4_9ROSI